MYRRLQITLRSLLALAALLALLAGSASAETSKALGGGEADDVITLWQAFRVEETAVFREVMDEFQKDYKARTGKTIRVELQYVSFDDMFTKLRTAALARITPDVAFMDSIKVTDLAFGQAVVPVEDLKAFKERYGTREKASQEFVSAAFNSGVVDRLGVKKLYALPVQTTTVALFWNKEMFRNKSADLRAAGLDPNRAPQDWDELIAYGKVLTDQQRGVYAIGLSSSLWFNFGIFNMYGVDFIQYQADGRASPAINTPNGAAALNRIQSIINSGVEGGAWQRGSLGPEPMFLNRQLAMCLTGPWNVENFANGGLDFDISLVPAPTKAEIASLGLQPIDPEEDPNSPAAYSSSNIGGQSGVIFRTCKNPELAFEVIDYFTCEKVQRRWASQLGQIPVRRAAWKDLDTSKYPYMKSFMRQLAKSKRIPQVPLYESLEKEVYNPQIDLLLQNKQTSQEMLKRMDDTMQRVIIDKINKAIPEK